VRTEDGRAIGPDHAVIVGTHSLHSVVTAVSAMPAT
jgi:hypothetical protein